MEFTRQWFLQLAVVEASGVSSQYSTSGYLNAFFRYTRENPRSTMGGSVRGYCKYLYQLRTIVVTCSKTALFIKAALALS